MRKKNFVPFWIRLIYGVLGIVILIIMISNGIKGSFIWCFAYAALGGIIFVVSTIRMIAKKVIPPKGPEAFVLGVGAFLTLVVLGLILLESLESGRGTSGCYMRIEETVCMEFLLYVAAWCILFIIDVIRFIRDWFYNLLELM